MSDEKLRALYSARVAADAPSDRAGCPSPEALERVAAGPKDGMEPDLGALDHVFSCAHCRTELALLRTVQNELATSEWSERDSALERSVAREGREAKATARQKADLRWFAGPRLAAAAAVLIAVAVVTQTARNRATDNVVRDAGDSSDVSVVSPAPNGEFANNGAFVWRSAGAGVTYEIQLLDTAGVVIASQVTSDTVYIPDVATRSRLDTAGVFDWFVSARRSDGNERRSAVLRVRVGRTR
ncbi:MAG: hypothetical protein ACO1Q7_03535 [Gemmatimonas sp.]